MATQYTMRALNTTLNRHVYWFSIGSADTAAKYSGYDPAQLTNIVVDYTSTVPDAIGVGNLNLIAGDPGPAGPGFYQGTVSGGSITTGNAILLLNNQIVPFSLSLLASAGGLGGVAISTTGPGSIGNARTQGPDVLIGSLGDGYACAVGCKSDGTLCRVTDASCVTGLNYVGYCDINGKITIAPRRDIHFNILDFGADPTGTNLCDAALSAVVNIASAGDTIFIPRGTFKYANTWEGFGQGVIVEGVGGSHITSNIPGSVLAYTGLGDGVRQGTYIDENFGGQWVMRDILIRCINDNNFPQQRQSPSISLPGSISTVTNNGGLIEIGMSAPHGLSTGNLVAIDSVSGTTEANNGWTITVIDSTHFTLNGSTFTHTYTSGGNIRTRCGAGLAAIGASQFQWHNVYSSGWSIGFLLDGAENCTLRNCIADGPSGNTDLGLNSKHFSCGIWLTDGDSGCSGFTVEGSTNTITIDDCVFSGNFIGVQIDGTASTMVRRSMQELSEPLLNTAITATSSSGGLIQITAVEHGLVTNDYAGISGVGGTTEANGEWQVTKVDNNNFTLNGSTFVHSWTSGGIVAGHCPLVFARINRAESLSFDTCYSEGSADAHFLFEKQTGSSSATTSNTVSIRNHFANGNCPAIKLDAVTVSNLMLFNNFWSTAQCVGGQLITQYCIRLGNYFSNAFTSPGATFWDNLGATAATGGLCADFNVNGSSYVNGIGGQEPTAHWHIPLQDNSTSLLRVSDSLPAFYWDFFVNSSHNSSFRRSVNSPGFGDKAGTIDDITSATLAQSAGNTLLATSSILPPKAMGHFKITITAHRDDDVAGTGAMWILYGSFDQVAAGTLLIQDGPHLEYSFIGDTGAYPSGTSIGGVPVPTLSTSSSSLTISAEGNINYASTWTVRIETTTSQRAR